MAGEEFLSLGLEATELRLGLPGDNIHLGMKGSSAPVLKRGFEDGGSDVDLKLKLPTSGMEEVKVMKRSGEECPNKPSAAKAQVVGWPPVRSFRRNIMTTTQYEKTKKEEPENYDPKSTINNAAAFVKVSMDGAPYLRKVDLKLYASYHELSLALEKMFSSFTSGNCDSQEINFMNESKLVDVLNGSDYVSTYQDKDGDWMLVGDVPWGMFVDSCKRLRIMKGSEAVGIAAPKTMEKCKNRN